MITAVVVLTSNLIIYFHPANQGWIGSDAFSWGNLLQFVLIDQFLIELITTAIIFGLIWFYAHWLKLYEIELTPAAISIYLLKFLPVLAIAFFFFNPFTQSVRFLWVEGTQESSSVYWNDYVVNFSLYPAYLIPTLLTGYGILITNLIILYNHQLKSTTEDLEKIVEEPEYTTTLIAIDDWGEVPLQVSSVIWFEKADRKYFANTLKGRLRTRETISELESSLDPSKFVRINRSVIVNVNYILNYSFWENEKYVLRLRDKDQTEFTMSRERLNKVKAQLKLTE